MYQCSLQTLENGNALIIMENAFIFFEIFFADDTPGPPDSVHPNDSKNEAALLDKMSIIMNALMRLHILFFSPLERFRYP